MNTYSKIVKLKFKVFNDIGKVIPLPCTFFYTASNNYIVLIIKYYILNTYNSYNYFRTLNLYLYTLLTNRGRLLTH